MVKKSRGARARGGAKAPRGRQEAMALTRAALLDAGAAMFAEEGLDAPSLDAICARAGYTRGAFYVHFRDREDFLVAVMERTTTAFLDAIVASGDEAQDLSRTVAAFADAVSSGVFPVTGRGAVRSHHVLDACARSPVVRRRYVDLLREGALRVERVVVEGQRAGSVRRDVAAREVAAVLVALVLGVQTMLETGAALDAPAAARTVLRLLAAPRRASGVA